jgi:uncharacterized protein YigA (DUF484 family)
MSGKARDKSDVEPVVEAHGVTAEEVAAYLRDHPDYLNENPELLQVLTPPSRWTGDGVIDMQGFILERLRAETEYLRNSANELVATTRSNLLVQTRAHAAALAILGTDSYDKLVHVVCFDLPLLLDVDTVALCFEAGDAGEAAYAPSDVRQLEAGTIDQLLAGSDDARLIENASDDGTVFGAASGLVRSAALVRLNAGAAIPPGLLALGARGPATFHPNQATELLVFVARILENALNRWLRPPR